MNFCFYVLLCFFIQMPIFSMASTAATSANSSVWVRTLNYQLGGRDIINSSTDDIDDSNVWHHSKKAFLAGCYGVLGRQNIAVGRVGIVYSEKDNPRLYVAYCDLPDVYVSGWSIEHLVADQLKFLTNFGRENGYRQSVCLKEAGEFSAKNADITYALHLKKIFDMALSNIESTTIHSDLRERLIRTQNVLEELSSVQHLRSDKGRETFSSRFYDTEQAMYRQLTESTILQEISQDLFARIPPNSTIHLVTLDIASYLDMCFDCADTAFCQMIGKGGFVDAVADIIFELGKEYNFGKMRAFVKVSSQHRCDHCDGDRNTRDRQTNYRSVDRAGGASESMVPLDANEIMPYIAQMKIEN